MQVNEYRLLLGSALDVDGSGCVGRAVLVGNTCPEGHFTVFAEAFDDSGVLPFQLPGTPFWDGLLASWREISFSAAKFSHRPTAPKIQAGFQSVMAERNCKPMQNIRS